MFPDEWEGQLFGLRAWSLVPRQPAKKRASKPIFSRHGHFIEDSRVLKESTSSDATATTSQPCNLYVSQDFSVSLKRYFQLSRLVTDNRETGVVHTHFDPFRSIDRMSLSDTAQKMKEVPNAGGSSVVSEVMSYEVLRRCFGAKLLKMEMEVSYFPEGGSITDYTCAMFDTTLGVSVTRAMKFKGDFTEEDAVKLLNKKLAGIIQSSQNSLEKWSKQILHVWATSKHVANVITQTFEACIHDNVKSNTVVLVTVATGANEIFYNKV